MRMIFKAKWLSPWAKKELLETKSSRASWQTKQCRPEAGKPAGGRNHPKSPSPTVYSKLESNQHHFQDLELTDQLLGPKGNHNRAKKVVIVFQRNQPGKALKLDPATCRRKKTKPWSENVVRPQRSRLRFRAWCLFYSTIQGRDLVKSGQTELGVKRKLQLWVLQGAHAGEPRISDDKPPELSMLTATTACMP